MKRKEGRKGMYRRASAAASIGWHRAQSRCSVRIGRLASVTSLLRVLLHDDAPHSSQLTTHSEGAHRSLLLLIRSGSTGYSGPMHL